MIGSGSRGLKLRVGETIRNPLTGTRYRIGELLGEGGYGRAYRCEVLSDRNRVLEEVCFKTTTDQRSWQRESYFGDLLTRSRRVIRTTDSFPLPPRNRRGRLLFGLVQELAEHGTIADYLERTLRPWTQARAIREISALLKVLDQLHTVNATHRDLTPMNVFVCRGGMLKLGDFGIARHELAGRPATIEAFNPDFVTRGFRDFRHRHWRTVDDVFQMGQILAMLLIGDAADLITQRTVNQLDCDLWLKNAIKRAIGPRAKRFADAAAMLKILQNDRRARLRRAA